MLTRIVRTDSEVRTEGRVPLELAVRVGSSDLLGGGEELLEYLVTYEAASGRELRSAETVAYGGWLLRLRQDEDTIVVEALDVVDESTFVPTADVAIEFMRDQRAVCTHCNADFAPPRVHHMVAASEAVLSGAAEVEGVRYPDREPRSGWLLNEVGFRGSIRDLSIVQTGRIVREYRSLATLLALPAGFRIRVVGGKFDAWFDPKVAAART